MPLPDGINEETFDKLTQSILEATEEDDRPETEEPYESVVGWETDNWKIESRFSDLLVTMMPQTGPHTQTIIWLHGLGDSAHGFKELFTDGDISVPPGTKIILPTAPNRKVTLLDGKEEFSWFDIKSLAKPIDHEYKTKAYLDANFDQK